MSNVAQSVEVCAELQVALNVLLGVVTDVKAGKSAGQVLGDALPGFIQSLESVAALQADLTSANSVAVDNTVVLFGVQLKQILYPGAI